MLNLLPAPKELVLQDQAFLVSTGTTIVLLSGCQDEDYAAAKLLQAEIWRMLGQKLAISKATRPKAGSICLARSQESPRAGDAESYTLEIGQTGVLISGAAAAGLFYGVQTLRQLIRQQGASLPGLFLRDWPDFKNRGFMLDTARGRVPTLESLKELADRLSFYKINQLQLYIEHSFAFAVLPEIWAGKDPLTAEEILELDLYCKSRQIELVPALATFSHFYEILRTETFQHLCELEDQATRPFSWMDRMSHHTLDVIHPGSLALVKSMLDEFIPLFSSKRFNLCGDETFDLGRGKNRQLAAIKGAGRLYVDFLNQIIALVEGHGKEAMVWSDVIVNHPDLIPEISDRVTFLNWNYEAVVGEDETRIIAQSGRQQYLCPGCNSWNRLSSDMDKAFANVRQMVAHAVKHGALGILNTDWGDYGHVNFPAASVPALAYGAALSWTTGDPRDDRQIDETLAVLEFGRENQSLVALLRELSRQEMDPWRQLVWLREQDISDHPRLPELIESLAQIDDQKILSASEVALGLAARIADSSAGSLSDSARQDLAEIRAAAQGIALFNIALVSVKRLHANTGRLDQADLPAGDQLANELDAWMAVYRRLWRNRSKDSELFRIQAMIDWINRQLRRASLPA